MSCVNRILAGLAAGTALALVTSAATAQESSTVEKCGKSFGTITVVDPRNGLGYLQQFGLGSPAALLRLMIQQSACFDVVERGVAMQNMQQERALVQSGAARADSNVGQGQIQIADFVMTPDVQIPTSTTNALGGALANFGRIGGMLGSLGGGLKSSEAVTSLLIADIRSSIQVAGAEGKASKTDFSIGGWAIGGGAAGSLGGYTSTPEGKVVAASLLDNYNKIVVSIRDKPQLIKANTPEAVANAQQSARAEAPLPAGQMLAAKIANVRVYAEPSRDSNVLATLQRGDEMVASGETRAGFARVDGATFNGWVQRTLVEFVGSAPVSQAAAVPPPTTLAPSPIAAPRYRYGVFTGTMEGADTGTFRVLIDDEGAASGDGNFRRLGSIGLVGSYEADKGQLVMQGGSSGGSILFIGRYDPSRGVIVGSWNLGSLLSGYVGSSAGGGSFRAQRGQ